MKLSMDLIREILLWCEENTPSKNKIHMASEIEVNGFTRFETIRHVWLLKDAGYLNISDASADNEEDWFINGLTWDSYQFIEAIKSDTVWNGMKEEAGKIGIQAIKLAIPILTEIVKKQFSGLL